MPLEPDSGGAMTFDSDLVMQASAAPAGCGWQRTAERDSARERWRERLRTVVEQRVLPSLAARHEASCPTMDGEDTLAERALEIATLVVEGSTRVAAQTIDGWLDRGLRLDALLLQVLTPAARRLGDLWLTDRLSFLDVTRGSSALQELLRSYAPAFEDVTHAPLTGKSILLAPVPGEQHLFGLSMVASFFRRAGWSVSVEPRADAKTLLARCGREAFDIIGMSASNEKLLPALADLVTTLRAASTPHHARILIGGSACRDLGPDHLGADAMAEDAREAVSMAESLVSQSPRPEFC